MRDKVNDKYNKDQFYEPISDDRRKELAAIAVQKKRLFSMPEMEKKNLEFVEDKFNQEFSEFMNKYMIYEKSRTKAIDDFKEIDVMSDYLVKKENINLNNII